MRKIMYSCKVHADHGGIRIAIEQSVNATEYSDQMFRCSRGTASEKCEDGDYNRDSKMKHTMRTLAPKACGGRLDLNFDLTTPLLPCGRVTRLHDINTPDRRGILSPYPQMTRTFDPAISFLARYTYATRYTNAMGQRKVLRRGKILSYLSEVELSILLGRDTLDLKEGSVRAGVALTTLMAENAPFAVESMGEKSGGSVLEPETRPCHPDETEPIHHFPGRPNPHPTCNKTTRDRRRRTHTVLMPFCVLEVVRWLYSGCRLCVSSSRGLSSWDFACDRDVMTCHGFELVIAALVNVNVNFALDSLSASFDGAQCFS
jgi:hypothetical protein